MSELPFYSTEARRRHNNNNISSLNSSADFEGTSHILPSNPSHGLSVPSSPQQRPKHPHATQPIPSSSFANLSSLIAPAASNFWNIAQNSIQSFTDQISNDVTANSINSKSLSSIENNNNLLLPTEMPFRDRTAEFRTVAKSCQLRQQPNGYMGKSEREKIVNSSIQFNQLAKRIGRDLSMTCAKMEKLAQLAKKKSLFDDRAGEVEELSQIIKQDITGLNKQIANLQQLATHRTSGGSSVSLRQEQQSQNHSKLVVVGLQSKLANISKNFQNVLEIRTENLKFKRERREKFSQSAAIPSNLPPSTSNGQMGSLLLHDEMASASSGSSTFALDMDKLEQQRVQEQTTLLLDDTEQFHQSRFNAMESIESSISELGTIFRQLATLVSEQGEMITRIDSNVEESSLNVEAAHHELLKYFNNISRNRWLIIKVFGVLMAFFVFFVIFLT
ncbi:hypothetical protein niasHS_010807 [Heterodera schachtii]|uniref:t-SNARE coiled-coil homology domain-containing protein n=1 Tax=Heterodera schachtii TaxID=97005 RepID=A0ABD2IZC6_HETSC